MGSTVSKLSDRYSHKNIFGEDLPESVYMQFVPGLVVSVITSKFILGENCEIKRRNI